MTSSSNFFIVNLKPFLVCKMGKPIPAHERYFPTQKNNSSHQKRGGIQTNARGYGVLQKPFGAPSECKARAVAAGLQRPMACGGLRMKCKEVAWNFQEWHASPAPPPGPNGFWIATPHELFLYKMAKSILGTKKNSGPRTIIPPIRKGEEFGQKTRLWWPTGPLVADVACQLPGWVAALCWLVNGQYKGP